MEQPSSTANVQRGNLRLGRKSDLEKLQGHPPRAETAIPVKWITQRVNLGIWESATTRLHAWKKRHAKPQA
jgi:hypothetical protein